MTEIHSFHASQASTSTTAMMDRSSSVGLGGRAIDRHNPIITDSRRLTSKESPTSAVYAASHDPKIQLKPHHHQPLNISKKASSKPTPRDQRKSSPRSSEGRKDLIEDSSLKQKGATKKTIALPGDLCTPPSSSRYLLSDTVLISDDSVLTSVLDEHKKNQPLDEFDRFANSNASSSSRSKPTSDQVVVLRVSLHCRGCEGKVRKHLSKMAGVTSFNIDSAAKKVTVVGDVTPLSVLASVSKVKTAKFWPFAPAASSTSGSDSKI